MVNICYLCKKGEIIHDKKMSGLFCTGCGECFELGAFTDEVQYKEDEQGRYTVVGTTYNVEKGFVNSKFSNHAQCLASVTNAKIILKRYCDKLYISESFAQISSGFYHQLLIKKFLNGRRLNIVLAACLYISVRTEGANVILLDISDVSEANVYDIGRYYFQIIRLLNFNIQTVDPCEYIVRFVEMLNLGDRNLPQVKQTALCIRETANRLVQRMKRDWIHYGRRPSGVCAAAVLVSARINNVRCSIKDIISIAKVCESTIRKRINEFIETPSSKLTFKEFMSKDIESEEDPPSYKFSVKEAVEANLDKVEKYQEIIEERLKNTRLKMRGIYTKFLKEIFIEQDHDLSNNEDVESSVIKETIMEQNMLALNSKIVSKFNQNIRFNDSKGNPSTEEINYWADLRPTAKSLGLLTPAKSKIDVQTDYEDLLSPNLDDIPDSDIEAYLVTDPDEILQREMEWKILNKDYLEKQKELLKRKQMDDEKSNTSKSEKTSTKNKKRKNADVTEALSACEAIKANSSLNVKNLLNDDSSSIQTIKSDSTEVDSGIELVNTFHSYALTDSKANKTLKTLNDEELEDKNNLIINSLELSNNSTINSKMNDEFDDELDDDYYDEEEEDELMKIKMKYSQLDDQCEELIEEDCGF